eukprot:2114108-Prymnesium_polylepis.1
MCRSRLSAAIALRDTAMEEEGMGADAHRAGDADEAQRAKKARRSSGASWARVRASWAPQVISVVCRRAPGHRMNPMSRLSSLRRL